MRSSRLGGERELEWRFDQLGLALAGTVAFGLGAWVHRDRQNLAVALVGLGTLLLVLSALLPRLQSFSAKGGGLELAIGLVPRPAIETDHRIATARAGDVTARQVTAEFRTDLRTDLRNAGAPLSGPAGFAESLRGGPADLVVINLESGRSWLTSRLFIFVAVLVELRGIDAVVFTHRPAGVDVTVGVTPARAMLERLAWAYPWLAEQLAVAWGEIRPRGEELARVRLSIDDAELLFQSYLSGLTVHDPDAAAGPQSQWVSLDEHKRERTSWIDLPLLRQLLGNELSEVSVREVPATSSTLLPSADLAALAFTGVQFVPVVSERHEFRSAVDRFALLETLRTHGGL
jgi:hypothetical protein